MADSRPDRDTELEPYTPRPAPKGSGPMERLHWDHAEQMRVYQQEARMDRGHTAVTMQARDIKASMMEYHAARTARLAAEEAAKSRGDVVGRIVDAWDRMPAGQRDAVYAEMTARQSART